MLADREIVRRGSFLSGNGTGGIETNPAESVSWRKHKNACPFYRERWFPGNDVYAGEPMYQVFCLKNTPPVTAEEQEKCFRSRTCCWRLVEQEKRKAKKTGAKREETPLHTA